MNPGTPITRIYGVVPAAGFGRRMGRSKQTLPFAGTTIVGKITRTLLDAELDGVVVVTRNELVSALDLPMDRRVSVAVNHDPESQMIDSIRIGLSKLWEDSLDLGSPHVSEQTQAQRANDDAGILVVPGDMPGLTASACQLCVRAFREEPRKIVVAVYAGQKGHPLILPSSLRTEVGKLQGGLNFLVRRDPERVRLVETNHHGNIEDIDTWEQYRVALTNAFRSD